MPESYKPDLINASFSKILNLTFFLFSKQPSGGVDEKLIDNFGKQISG
jgi:hypothetical protein